MAAELPRPGVEVIQVFRSTSPTVITPTLVPCVVGVAKEVLSVRERDASGSSVLNSNALVSLPAFFVAEPGAGTPPRYTGLHNLRLVLSVNHGPKVTVTLSDPTAVGLTPETVVDQIGKALSEVSLTHVVAEVVRAAAFQVRTTGLGEFQSLTIDASSSPAVLSAFGIGADKTYVGTGGYRQRGVVIPATSFPAPRKNLDELTIEPASVRVFLALGSAGNIRELFRNEALLRTGEVLRPAVVLGSVPLSSLTLPEALDDLMLEVRINGGEPRAILFTAAVTTPAELFEAIRAGAPGFNAHSTSAGMLELSSDAVGADASIEILAGSAVARLGLRVGVERGLSIEGIDDGDGDVFTSFVRFPGENFVAMGTAATFVGTLDLSTLALPADLAGKSLEVGDGSVPQRVTFSTENNLAAVLTKLNDVLSPAAGGHVTATLNASQQLVLTSDLTGIDSIIELLGGTALVALGLSAATARGTPGHVRSGDELWIDGQRFAEITQVAPGGQSDVLRVARSFAISNKIGQRFFIVAKNLKPVPEPDRPLPELVVATDGSAVLKPELLRNVHGLPLSPQTGRAPIALSYTAIRRDVTARAKSPGLVRVDSVIELENQLAPINTQNPLALGLFFALANAAGVEVTGLGVDAISSDEPFGTVEAFARAAEYLEGVEVYAIAPLTHNPTVGQIFNAHAGFMSEPAQKGERIVIFNPAQPTHSLDRLVASGPNGNSIGAAGVEFDTGVSNLGALLLAKDVSPTGTIPVSAGVFLDIASDGRRYSVEAVSGSVVRIRTTFAAFENPDEFYARTVLNAPPLPNVLINETFAIRIRGSALKQVDGSPDKHAMAATYQALGQSFQHRRFWMTAPNRCKATIGGLEQGIDGFYLNAAIAGLIAQQPPQQSFTNFPMVGFTGLEGSNDFFSDRQLNVMAAGGTYVMVQDVAGGPVVSRMALTTDMTSIETRTDSITKIMDFVAKFLRRGVRNFVGNYNITQGFLDALGSVIQGLLGFLVETRILISASPNNIIQDEDQPDTTLIDITVDVPVPSNYIRLTLLV